MDPQDGVKEAVVEEAAMAEVVSDSSQFLYK